MGKRNTRVVSKKIVISNLLKQGGKKWVSPKNEMTVKATGIRKVCAQQFFVRDMGAIMGCLLKAV